MASAETHTESLLPERVDRTACILEVTLPDNRTFILLIHRNQNGKSWWEFPGGTRGWQERELGIEANAQKELAEETGIDAADGQLQKINVKESGRYELWWEQIGNKTVIAEPVVVRVRRDTLLNVQLLEKDEKDPTRFTHDDYRWLDVTPLYYGDVRKSYLEWQQMFYKRDQLAPNIVLPVAELDGLKTVSSFLERSQSPHREHLILSPLTSMVMVKYADSAPLITS